MEKIEGIERENGSTEENQSFKDGSICGYDSLHRLLGANLKPQIFQVFPFSNFSTLFRFWVVMDFFLLCWFDCVLIWVDQIVYWPSPEQNPILPVILAYTFYSFIIVKLIWITKDELWLWLDQYLLSMRKSNSNCQLWQIDYCNLDHCATEMIILIDPQKL